MTALRTSPLVLVLCASLIAGCGGDGGDDGGGGVDASGGGGDTDAGGGGDVDAGGGSDVSCSVTAEVIADEGSRTMTGVGRIDCDGSATLTVETCVQWDSSGEFEDIQCQTSTRSDRSELEVEALAGCGIGQGNSFRARVNADANGASEPEVLSDEVGCD